MTEQQHDPDPDPGADEVGRIEALDERFGRIESEQAEHRQLLEQIRDAIAGTGAAGSAHRAAQKRTEDRLAEPPAASVAEQVRAAVEAVGAEKAEKERAAAHDADHQRMREQAERPPREAMPGFRGRLSRAMFGGEG